MRIDGFVPTAAGTANGTSDIVSRLKPGDNIRVQLLENSGNDLTLRLSDGTVLSAAANGPVEAAEGEFVNLTFKGTIDGKPAFEVSEKALLPQGDKVLENVKNQLVSLKLPLSEQNIRIALALTEQNVNLTAESMEKMTGLLKSDPSLKADTAAFLTASRLSDDANSIDKLKSLLAGRLKLGEDISRLVKLLETQARENSGQASQSHQLPELAKLVQKVAARLAGDGSMAGSLPGSAAAPGKIADIAGGAAGTEIKTGNNAPDGGAAALKNNSGNSVNVSGRGGMAEVFQDNKLNTAGSAQTAQAAQGTQPAKTDQPAEVSATAQASAAVQAEQTAQGAKSVPDEAVPAANTEKGTIRQPLANTPGSIPVDIQLTDEVIKKQAATLLRMLKGEAPPGESDFTLLKAFDRELVLLMNSGKLSLEEMKTAGQLAGEKRVFEAAVHGLTNLHIRVSEASDEINPVRLYKEMDSLLHILKNGLPQLPQTMREAAAAVVSNLESNINFINQLNNYSSYVQLPLSIFDRNTTGELYMLKKGSKNKKLDPENMTVLISLDTDNLGRVDTLLSVSRRNISTNFRLENSEVFPLLRDNHKMLYNSLLEKGFRLVDYTYRLMDEPISIVNFETEAKKEFLKSSSSIDITI
ncbi:flagellar hook-length control protein FliK [Ruminiclostridium hungatei]|uniref:Flagellar hook-length control protein FliK n=1 Tax=Ruminiclostridium hungatei TaxID=48256 RepID=A0A1V4SF01_RUMHU|nr:flagellar hook-length control protein FliK [Ruminiclostridium hungatei]OPX42492.1 flagellar hook-length control protein FliK [Ruminiclostridium hungatei]